MENLSRRDFVKGAAVGAVGVSTISMEACNAQAWLTTALNDLPTIVNIATSILSIVGAFTGVPPAALALATTAAQKAHDVLVEAQTFLAQYEKNKQPGVLNTVFDALETAQTQLGSILAIVGVNNPTLQATLAAAIGSALTIITAVQALIPMTTPTTPPTTTAAVKASAKRASLATATPKDQSVVIKEGYNESVTAAGGAQYRI